MKFAAIGRSWRGGGRADLVAALLVAVLCGFFLIMLARVLQLQVSPGEALSAHMNDRVTVVREPGSRGDLLDRRGRLLAASRFAYRVFVDPTRFPVATEDSLQRLADALDQPIEDVAQRILPRVAENQRRAALKAARTAAAESARRLAPLASVSAMNEPAGQVEQESQDRPLIRYVPVSGVIEDWRAEVVRGLRMPGVHLELRSVRENPAPELAVSLVGLVNIDHVGVLGAERLLNQSVSPSSGRLQFVRDAYSRPLWVEQGGYVAPQRGRDERLSIDLEIQRMAVEELERGIADANAAGGRLIAMDPLTGEIVAMVDIVRQPADAVPYDWSSNGSNGGRRRYITIHQNPRAVDVPALARNRCVEDVYEPGSTFKPFMWAATTDLGLASVSEVIDTEGGLYNLPYGRRTIKDVVKRQTMTWSEVLIHSSNIGMAKITRRMSDGQMRDAVLRFGFGRRTGIGLPGESGGIVTGRPPAWSKYTQTSVAMGHEIAVTPVQMVRAFSAFARTGPDAGTIISPRLTAAESDRSESAPAIVRVVSPRIADLTRQTMRGVAMNAERKLANTNKDEAPGRYELFGKSGTAMIPLPKPPQGKRKPRGTGGYFQDQYNSSFIAAAPADHPRLVVLCVIDDPGPEMVAKRTHYGSSVAYPVTRRFMDRALAYLGVPPSAPQHAATAGPGQRVALQSGR